MSRRQRKHGISTSPQVDVVIPTSGRFDMLRLCLEALDKQEGVNFEIHIVDIASDAEERIANQDVFEERHVKRLQQNVGFPAGTNEGARMGSAHLILFLNDDVTLEDGALAKMVEVMNDSSIGVCGAKLCFPLNSTSPIRPAGKVQHIGLSLNIRGEIIHPLVGWSSDNPRTCQSRDVLAVTGACLMVRRNLFNKVGGFEPAYGLGTFEDVDLCFKIRQAGFRVYVTTEAKGFHFTGATAEKKRVAFPIQQNSMIFRSQWAGTPFFSWDDFTFYSVVAKPVEESTIKA